MWFELWSWGWLILQQGQGKQRMCTKPDECMSGQCSGRRIPEGAATMVETMTSGCNPSNKLRTGNEPTGTMDQNSRTSNKSTKSMEWAQIVVLVTTRKASDSAPTTDSEGLTSL